MARRRKVLFFAEGATLAHVARPLVLAENLEQGRNEVVFARPPGFAWMTASSSFRNLDLDCQPAALFARRLERGAPLYDYSTLRHYVEADLELIDRERPDVIVGDFRLSLSVSARISGIPYVTLCDAYWSPERPLRPALPVLAFTPYVPLIMAEWLFRALSPLALRLHAAPLERLRADFGLPDLGHDLRRCYTDADLRLFANFPALFPEIAAGPSADFIGPIAWSPADRADLDIPVGEGPLVYLTMGSSGDPDILARLIPALVQAGCRTLVASAGKPLPAGLDSARTRYHAFLPGAQLCRHADLVICNGGSPTTNQALARGVPVLGIARNMDQFLNMRAIEDYGAGLTLRADRAGDARIRQALAALLAQPGYRARAHALAEAPGPSRTLAEQLDRLAPASTSVAHARRA